MLIRQAGLGDARAIATIHVESWRGAYRGLVPDEYLDGLSIDRREAFWREVLAHPPEWRQRTWIAEHDAQAIGFATAGAARDPDLDRGVTGELQAIYVLPSAWRAGAGRALAAAAESFLRAERFALATLWVLDGNARARAFYEAMGWGSDGATKHEVWDGAPMDEVRYRKALATIRSVMPSDGPSLGAIQVAIRPQLAIDFPAPHDPAGRSEMWGGYLRSPPVEGFRGWVAELGGEVVAFLISGVDDGDVTIYDLYVEPKRQRLGIGGALLAHACAAFRDSGRNTASLWTAEGNVGSRRFYERLGWSADVRRRTEQGAVVRYRITL